MNPTRRVFTLASLALALALLTGCNLWRMLAFRSQMRAIQEFTAWEGKPDAVFVFKKPLFTLGDLNDFGLFPEKIDADNAVLRYRRVGAAPEIPTTYDFRLSFIDGKLARLGFPAPLRDGLGQETIQWLFSAMGGGDAPGGGWLGVAKDLVVSGGLLPKTAEGPGSEVRIDLRALDPRNQSIVIELTEKKHPGYYSNFSFTTKPNPLAKQASRGAKN